MTCASCQAEITRDSALEVGGKSYCSRCFFKVAEAFRGNLTPEQRRYLKEVVSSEMEGILPRGLLKDVVLGGLERILSEGADPEEEANHIVNRVEQICGLTMFREMLAVVDALKSTLDQQDDELRDKIRKLGKL